MITSTLLNIFWWTEQFTQIKWINAFISKDTNVLLDVIFESTLIFKFFVTIGTRKRSDFIVYWYLVSVQAVGFEKFLITFIALVHFFFVMNFSDVSSQPVGLRKCFLAVWAGKFSYCKTPRIFFNINGRALW